MELDTAVIFLCTMILISVDQVAVANLGRITPCIQSIKFEVMGGGGLQGHSTEVAYLLLTKQPRE